MSIPIASNLKDVGVSDESSLWRGQENVESDEVPKLENSHLVDLFHLRKKLCRRSLDVTRGNGQLLYRVFSSILQELKGCMAKIH